MDIDLRDFNVLAILLSAFATFMVGGIWYGALFAKAWAKENGFSEADLKKGNQALIFGGSFLLALVASTALAILIDVDADLKFGTIVGLIAGICVSVGFGINYLFEMKTLKLFLINATYNLVTFTLMGAILGQWL
jgi:hypothetical protein